MRYIQTQGSLSDADDFSLDKEEEKGNVYSFKWRRRRRKIRKVYEGKEKLMLLLTALLLAFSYIANGRKTN